MNAKSTAYAVLVLSGATSIAFNVYDVRNHGAFAVLTAPVWPIMAMMVIHLITDVKWPVGRIYALTRFGAVGVVALGAAIVSFSHIAQVMLAMGEGPVASYVAPFVLDGGFILASVVLGITPADRARATRAQKKRARK